MTDSISWAFIHPFQLRLQRGIEVYLWNLAAALSKTGVHVDILTWDGPLDIPEYASHAGICLHKVPMVRYFQDRFGVLFYVYWLLYGKYNHVFVNFANYGEGLALHLARLVRPIPFSLVFHFPRSQVPQRYREFEHWNFQHEAAHLIAVSKATAQSVDSWSGRRCTVIRHGVDTERFHPDSSLRIKARQELGIEDNAPVLISVAALEERKGMQWVIQALPNLLPKLSDLHYIIIGDGPFRKELNKLIHQYNLGSYVHLLGWQLDIQHYLCAADIMMVLSKGEASSISLLEALACGIPAITSKYPPFDELIREAYGLRVDEENASQVVTAILRLLEDSGTRLEMGVAGRAWMIENYSWDRSAAQYQSLLAEHL